MDSDPKNQENKADPAQYELERQKLEIENQKLSIEQQKLEIEIEKLKIEKSKFLSTSLIGIIPLLALIVTVFYGVWTQRQQEKYQFQIKAAEIMFNSPDAYVAKAKADILKNLFPDKIFTNFSESFFPDSLGANSMEEATSKKELIKLLTSNAKDNSEIIKIWKRAFPGDSWVDSLLIKK